VARRPPDIRDVADSNVNTDEQIVNTHVSAGMNTW
jgi:hypothetical protein